MWPDLLPLVVGFLLAVRGAAIWDTFWRWRNQVSFDVSDPIFGRDVSFYVFSLPAWEAFVRFGLLLCLAAAAGALALYYFKGAFALRLESISKRSRAVTHVSLLAGCFSSSWRPAPIWTASASCSANHEVISGANYADLHARVPMLTLLSGRLIGALLWIFNAFASRNRWRSLVAGPYLVVLFGGNIYPALIQKFIVSPNELDKESPQIKHNIDATLKALRSRRCRSGTFRATRH